MKDILGKDVNVGDTVVAPFGKDYSEICEVVSLRPKTCIVMIDDGNQFSKHYDSIVVVDSITEKLKLLGL